MRHSISKFIDTPQEGYDYGKLNFTKLLTELYKNVEDGLIKTQTKGDLVLFDYTNECTFSRSWNDATRIARGLVLDVKAGRVVALPFEKFFNHGGEHDEHGLELGGYHDDGYFEKMDGSCVIIYHYNDEWHINTRGSFNSDQAIKAKEIFEKTINHDALSEHFTYIAEVIYKDNRIVVDYKDREALVLTGVYNCNQDCYTDFGRELYQVYWCLETFCKNAGFETPAMYKFDDFKTAVGEVDTYDSNREGYVYRSANGVRVKIKGAEYCRVHGLIAYHTPLMLWRCFVYDGEEACNTRKKDIPEELWDEYDDWIKIFKLNIDYIRFKVKELADQYTDLSDNEMGLVFKNFKSPWKRWIFQHRKTGDAIAEFGTLVWQKQCTFFKPKNNQIIKLYEQ